MIKNIIFTGRASELPRQEELHRRNFENNDKEVISIGSYVVEIGNYYIIEVCYRAPKEPLEVSKFVEDDDGNIYKVIFEEKGKYDGIPYIDVTVEHLSEERENIFSKFWVTKYGSSTYEWTLKDGSVFIWNVIESSFSSDELKKIFDFKFKE